MINAGTKIESNNLERIWRLPDLQGALKTEGSRPPSISHRDELVNGKSPVTCVQ